MTSKGMNVQSPGKARSAFTAVITVAMLGSCAVGPDFKRPAAPDVTGYTAGPSIAATAAAAAQGIEPQRFAQDRDIPADWWTLFRCEALNRLIGQALRGNPDFEAAQAALRQANETVLAGRGALFPAANLSLQAGRERLAGAVIGQRNFAPTFSVVTALLDVSYAPDVFGGTRRQVESLAARAEYEDFALKATYITLTSNLVIAAVQEAALRGQIAATEEILRSQSAELDLVEQKFRVGVVSQSEVLLQEAMLDQTRATLPTLRKQLSAVRNELAALTGSFPGQAGEESFDFAALTLPLELPVSLPSRLVEQRPDVREAEAALHAASAELGVAVADQLPQFSITAGLGTTAAGFADLPGTRVWNLAAGLGQPLFDAGSLLHRKRAAAAALDRAAAQYRSTVIRAFQDVADVLHALQADADDLIAQDAAERSARASLELAQRQFHAQTVDQLAVLTAEAIWQQARIRRIQAQANRYVDTAALFQALGGGWWHQADARQAH